MEMMEVHIGLNTVDRAVLTPIVRSALGKETIEVDHWRCQRLKMGTGPMTEGVYRFEGMAHDKGKHIGWSVVLKVVALPGDAMFEEVAHPLYWKREVLAFQSGLLNDLPGELEVVRCLGIEERAAGVYWLWLEDARDRFGQQWPLAQYARAARALGVFNGAYLTSRSIPDYAWLVRSGSPRGLINYNTQALDAIRDLRTWEHPLVQAAFPVSLKERLVRLWDGREALFDAIERMPQTLSHLDAWRGNLFSPQGQDGRLRLVAIDWAYLGWAAVGTDIGDLFAPSFGLFGVQLENPAAFDKVIFENYMKGLQETGWQGDRRLVRFTFAAFAALKYGCLTLGLVDVAKGGKHPLVEHFAGHSLEEYLDRLAVLLPYLLDLGDEAHGLLSSLKYV
ncbi:MAG TPA: hypothetical protein VGE45_06185 [Chloroflexia bacterium]|jgi:hypothetical protein